MCEVACITAHAAIVARLLARFERLVGRVRTYLLEDEAQDVVVQAARLVGAVVCGELEVVAGARFFALGALAAESFHESHDAVGEGAVGQLEESTWRGQGVVNLEGDKSGG